MDYFLEAFEDKQRYVSIGIFSAPTSLTPNHLHGFIMAKPDYMSDEKRAEFCTGSEKALIILFKSRIAYISILAVHPNSMRRGFATKMMNILIDACKKWNPRPTALYLHVKSDNERAIKFYEKCGFLRDSLIKK